MEVAELSRLPVDLQVSSLGDLPRAEDSRILAWQAALEPGFCLFSWVIKNPEQRQYLGATLPVLSLSSARCQQHGVMMIHTASEISRE